jgi:hypothetical protein
MSPLATLKAFWKSGGFGPDITIEGTVPKETWLIHFSDHHRKIAEEGFRKGNKLIPGAMAVTGPKTAGGEYNFAFIASDEYSLLNLPGMGFMGGSKTKAVMFKSDGVGMQHYDGFNQVCFHGPSVAGPFFILEVVETEDDDIFYQEPHERAWKAYTADGSLIGEGEDLFEAMTLVENQVRCLTPLP